MATNIQLLQKSLNQCSPEKLPIFRDEVDDCRGPHQYLNAKYELVLQIR